MLIDALDQFEPTVRASHLSWLPKSWPANARLIATAIPGTDSAALMARPDCRQLPVPPVSREEARELAKRFYREHHHRDVNPKVLKVLFEKPLSDGRSAHGNPLWLALALHEMNLLEADDFERADHEFAHLDGTARMEALQLTEAAKLPADVPGVYGELLGRVDRVFGKPRTAAFTGLIALGRAGWRESDLRAVMPLASCEIWDDLAFSGIRRLLGTHVVQRGAHAQWDFAHAALRDTVLRRDLTDESARRRLHALLVDHLENLFPGDPLRTSEIMVHLIGIQDSVKAANYLGSVQLTKEEETGAILALSEYIKKGKVVGDYNKNVDWLITWIHNDRLDHYKRGNICLHFFRGLVNRIEYYDPADLRDVRNLLDHVIAVLIEIHQIDTRNILTAVALIEAYLKIAAIYVRSGDFANPMKFLKAAIGTSETIIRLFPNDIFCLSLLLKSYSQYAKLLSELNQYAEAMLLLNRALKHIPDLKALSNLPPTTLQLPLAELLQQPLAILLPAIEYDYLSSCQGIYLTLGDILRTKKQWSDAIENYEKAYTIYDLQTLKKNNDDLEKSNEGVLLSRIGEAYAETRNYEKANEYLQKDLMISEKNEADHLDCSRDLSISYAKIGDLYARMKSEDKALVYYDKSALIREKLAQRLPDNFQLSRDVVIIHFKIFRSCQSVHNAKLSGEHAKKCHNAIKILLNNFKDSFEHVKREILSMYVEIQSYL
ncbi:MAG: tetratricopeptide repeat protein [Desulfobacterales bacterium]|nr:tetratricopeptide repeat protein [Desulfobacterales bacterium]